MDTSLNTTCDKRHYKTEYDISAHGGGGGSRDYGGSWHCCGGNDDGGRCAPPPCSARRAPSHPPPPPPPPPPPLPTPSEASVYVCCRLLRPCGAPATVQLELAWLRQRPCQPSELCGGVTAAAPSPRALQPCWTAECTARANAGRRTRRCGRAPFENGRGTFVSPPPPPPRQRLNLRRGFGV